LADLFDAKVETDAEISKKLLQKYNDSYRYSDQLAATEERIVILSNIEYYLHQYDNAIDFDTMGGLKTLVADFSRYAARRDDSSNGINNASLVRSWMSVIAHCFGSAMSSNPKVQIAALKLNLLTHLLSSIRSSVEYLDGDTNDVDDMVLTLTTRSFYALAALTRNFPHAQNEFAAKDGVTTTKMCLERVLSRLEKSASLKKTTIKSFLKLALRLSGFVSDLLVERRDYLGRIQSTSDDLLSGEDQQKRRDEDLERQRQYLQVDVESLLIQAGCCRLLERLTAWVASAGDQSSQSSRMVTPTIDDVDKTISPVEAFIQLSSCELRQDGRMRKHLTLMKHNLEPMMAEEEQEEGESGDRTVRDLVERINAVVELIAVDKTEL